VNANELPIRQIKAPGVLLSWKIVNTVGFLIAGHGIKKKIQLPDILIFLVDINDWAK